MQMNRPRGADAARTELRAVWRASSDTNSQRELNGRIAREKVCEKGRSLTSAQTKHPLPDGEHFISIKEADTEPITRMNVVLNWFEELTQKVPVEN